MKRIAFSISGWLIMVAVFGSVRGTAQTRTPVDIFATERVRVNAWQWFSAPPATETYGYVESLLRVGVRQRIQHWDWQLELSQPAVLGLPSDAISVVPAQGQLGFGGTYYATGGNNLNPAAAFLKQGFVRYRFSRADRNVRVGRFEFFGGEETRPANPTIQWLQANRIAQRLVGNFGFSDAQRSFDGVDVHYGAGTWNVTAMAARADQGVFNMNGNPELNVDLQSLAYTKSEWSNKVLWRVFAIGYHDGRTGILKTDNRPLAARQADHGNIRLGTYGGDFLAAVPAGKGELDFLAWGALQNGNWGVQTDGAGAAAVEGGYRFRTLATMPWVRAGWFRGSGDNNPTDNEHNTFFQVLATARVYARFPIYNLMNNSDQFVQVIDKPNRRLNLRSDLHWVQLASSKDLWYQGGGAFDNKAFGYVGRPANAHSSLTSVADISADWRATDALGVSFYYGYAWGKTVVAAIYPAGRTAQLGYVELTYQWGRPQTKP